VKKGKQLREESLTVGNLSPNQLQKKVILHLQLIVAAVEVTVVAVALHLQVQDLHQVEIMIVTLQKSPL